VRSDLAGIYQQVQRKLVHDIVYKSLDYSLSESPNFNL